ARRGERAPGEGGAGTADEGPHDVDHRAPAVHREGCTPGGGPRRGAHRPERAARDAPTGRRIVPATGGEAVRRRVDSAPMDRYLDPRSEGFPPALVVGTMNFGKRTPEHSRPLEPSLRAVEKLIASGKVGAFGVSNFASWQLLEMIQTGLKPRVSQQMYNLLVRQLEIEYFRFTRKYGVHTTVYNPLA